MAANCARPFFKSVMRLRGQAKKLREKNKKNTSTDSFDNGFPDIHMQLKQILIHVKNLVVRYQL